MLAGATLGLIIGGMFFGLAGGAFGTIIGAILGRWKAMSDNDKLKPSPTKEWAIETAKSCSSDNDSELNRIQTNGRTNDHLYHPSSRCTNLRRLVDIQARN